MRSVRTCARLSLHSLGGGIHEISTATDALGRFEFKNLDPGRYGLTVERYGYVRQSYGETSPGSQVTLLSLSSGQKVSNITIQLVPGSVITGHVYDADGDPVMGAHVWAPRYSYVRQHQLVAFQDSRTNDLGEFRLYGLAPGKYIVRAEGPPNRVAKPGQAFLRSYYPGVADLGRATLITLRSGDEFSGADVNLPASQAVTIRGRVIKGVSGGPASVFRVQLVARGPNTLGNERVQSDFVIDAQGVFAFRNVPPGSYYVHAESSVQGQHCEARLPVEVADSDLDGIILTLAPGVKIKGQIRVEGKPDANLGGVGITLSSGENGTFASESLDGQVKRDGAFLFEGAFDGNYALDIQGFPENYFLKSARLAGIDVLTAGIIIDTKQPPGLLDILVSPNGAGVEGVVAKDHQPFRGVTVAIVPDPPHRGEERLFKSTSTHQLGHFLLQGIPPGDYRVFAWESVEPGAYTSPEFLQRYENRGESLQITEGSHVTVNLELIPKTDVDQ